MADTNNTQETLESLGALKYKALQALAKNRGIKANLSKGKLIQELGDPVYAVPDGVEIQSLRGLLKAGDEVLPRYLRGGVKVLVELVSKGILVKK